MSKSNRKGVLRHGHVVEWKNAKATDIMWRYPNDRLKWGSVVICKPSRWAYISAWKSIKYDT